MVRWVFQLLSVSLLRVLCSILSIKILLCLNNVKKRVEPNILSSIPSDSVSQTQLFLWLKQFKLFTIKTFNTLEWIVLPQV